MVKCDFVFPDPAVREQMQIYDFKVKIGGCNGSKLLLDGQEKLVTF
jgi:hypothetical protein